MRGWGRGCWDISVCGLGEKERERGGGKRSGFGEREIQVIIYVT